MHWLWAWFELAYTLWGYTPFCIVGAMICLAMLIVLERWDDVRAAIWGH
jgi:hypothetical protein